MIIIKNTETGEIQAVNSTDGYDGWDVLATDAREPAPFESWDESTGDWLLDTVRRDDADEVAEMRDYRRLREFAKRMRRKLQELEDRIATLEGQ